MKKDNKNNKDIVQKVKIDDSEYSKPENAYPSLPSRDNKKIDKIVEHIKNLVKKSEENK